ncbi:MAG: cation diffusion facilitator family transporter [Betaproteobacteria bacterium]|jgi:cobalt-zinc-cadmium efflux system protein
MSVLHSHEPSKKTHSDSDVSEGEMWHAHKAGDAKHSHFKESTSQRVLIIALVFTLGFAGIEAVAGFFANSLALISDAGHMVTDAAALFLAVVAQIISKRPPSSRYSFGLGRAEALAAFFNGVAMLVLVLWIGYEAFSRFKDPHQVAGGTVTIVAIIGLAINVIVAWILSRDNKSVNTKAALVHVMGDMLGSIAALIAGVVIQYTGWMQIDPLLSIVVCLLLINSTWGVLKESYHFLMKGVPIDIDYIQVGKDISSIEGVNEIHDLHVWEMTPGYPALIGHIEISDLSHWPLVMERIKHMLLEEHGIDHVTLQPEVSGSH